MRSPRLKSGWAAWLLYLCVAVLLLATTVESAHICGLGVGQSYASTQNDSASSPAGSFCAMCLLVHSVAAALVWVAAFSPLFRRSAGRFLLRLRFVPVLTSFQLYVRPPPAW